MLDLDLCDDLAVLLAYPRADFRVRLESCLARAERDHSDTAGHLFRFAKAVDGLSIEQLQEQYTATFDVNPPASLEVGWHLYGENYDRGAFMVRMREALAAAGVEESSELPDHLTHLISLVGRLDVKAATTLTVESIRPALDKMVAGLEPSKSPFLPLLSATRTALDELVGEPV
ncbi:MAG: nitrate reductase molybdenum cofactor assembly chaperone [Vicinamibacterales bacterium]|jgi:nitrate reductase delta subunit|nr:nitrate reductase molybdenum cofactor assembly chaperone [Vicinamibacterales bacterium]